MVQKGGFCSKRVWLFAQGVCVECSGLCVSTVAVVVVHVMNVMLWFHCHGMVSYGVVSPDRCAVFDTLVSYVNTRGSYHDGFALYTEALRTKTLCDDAPVEQQTEDVLRRARGAAAVRTASRRRCATACRVAAQLLATLGATMLAMVRRLVCDRLPCPAGTASMGLVVAL